MSNKSGIIVTPEMAQAGYEAVQRMADQHGYGWSFHMVAEHTVEVAMGEVFRSMVAAAPEGWGPHGNPGPLPPIAERAPSGDIGEQGGIAGLPGPYDVPPPEAA